MKTKFSLVMVAMLLLVSCSQEETVNDPDIQEANLVQENPETRSFKCDPNYSFPVVGPKDTMYNITWSIEYAAHLTPEEVICVRQEYFTQSALALKMCILQPIDTHQDCWKQIPGTPSQTTSTTIDDDPRLTGNNTSGG